MHILWQKSNTCRALSKWTLIIKREGFSWDILQVLKCVWTFYIRWHLETILCAVWCPRGWLLATFLFFFLACSNIWWKLIIFVLALSPRVKCFNSQSDVSSTHTQIERKSRLQNAPMMSEKRRLLPIKSERKMKGNLARTKNAQTAQSRSLPSDFFTYICEV